MNKLRLDPDTLLVESFDTREDPSREREEGTVFANFTRAGGGTCAVYYTCPECATPWPECGTLYCLTQDPAGCDTFDLAACDTRDPVACPTQDPAACAVDTAFPC